MTYPIREDKSQITLGTFRSSGLTPFWAYEKLHPPPNMDFEAFCQTWLFFGLINELLGDICRPADFVRLNEAGDDKIITTSLLLGLIDQWVKSMKNGSSTVTYEHLAECLHLTFGTLKAAGPEFDVRIKVCIASVGELFAYATNEAFGIENMVLGNRCPVAWHSLIDRNSWIEQMGRSGLCPSQTEIIMRSSRSLQSLYFFASMEDSISAGNHRLCENQKCVSYQTDLKDYATRHVIKQCRCEELYIDLSGLNAILTSGGLPLLRIHEAEMLGELTVEIVPYQISTCYLALSHVWADGLGNAKANALPRCQLLRLSKLIQNLKARLNTTNPQTELLFWCDTLCCPIAPREAKNRVLMQMRKIYERATCVLVVDTRIGRYVIEAMSAEEACARIQISGWMRRLWTLQEGALAGDDGRLWFQFRDQAVNFRSLWQRTIASYHNNLGRRGFAGNLIPRMTTFATFFHRSSNDPGADLATVNAALQHRSVSVSSDEPLLIGTLLGLDVAEILNGTEETRMHRMWSLMPTAVRGLPKDILFRLGPRLREEGYRWAPSSMLYYEDGNAILQTIRRGDNQGIPTSQGLMVCLSGYHVSFPQRPSGIPASTWGIVMYENTFHMRDGEARWYYVRRRWPSAEGDYLSSEKFGDVMRSHANLWVTHLETDFQARSDGFQQTSTALLTKLIEERCDVKYVQSYMHIHVAPVQKATGEMREAAYQCAQKLAESTPAQELAHMSKNNVNMDSAEYKIVFDALWLELHRIAASGEYELARTIARQSSGKDDDHLFTGTVGSMFMGNYAIMGPRTPETQQWCVD